MQGEVDALAGAPCHTCRAQGSILVSIERVKLLPLLCLRPIHTVRFCDYFDMRLASTSVILPIPWCIQEQYPGNPHLQVGSL